MVTSDNRVLARSVLRLAGALVAIVLVLSPLRAILAKPNDIAILPSLQVDAAAYDEIARVIAKSWSLSEIPPLQPPGFVTTIAAVYAVRDHRGRRRGFFSGRCSCCAWFWRRDSAPGSTDLNRPRGWRRC